MTAPFDLPDGWTSPPLADVCKIERGITFPAIAKSAAAGKGKIACLRTTNVQAIVDWDDLIYVSDGYVKNETKILRANDILISMANSLELVGKVAFVDHLPMKSTFGGFISSIRAFDKVIPRFLFYFLRTNSAQGKMRDTASRSVNIANLSLGQIYQIPIPLPPLPEQQRIVARIEELARRVEEARGLRKTAVEEADALLEIAVGKVFENQTPIEARLLGRLATKIGSGSTPTGGRASYPSSGIPFIRSQNVRMREFQMEGIAFIDEATHKSMKGTIVQPNDVLLNITGASIGRVACVPDDLKEANINQHVAIIRPTQELHPRYLMYWLSQPKIQEFINSEQKGATRQGFTKQQIEKFNVLLLPLDEQHRIVAHLDNLQQKVDELRRLQAATQKELDALMPSILAKAFAGEL